MLGAGSDEVRGAVSRLLADDVRASVFGQFAGPDRAEPLTPPGLREYDEKIAGARKAKDDAIDAKDFDGAAALRDSESACWRNGSGGSRSGPLILTSSR